MARRAAGSDRAQPDRDHGRVHVDQPPRQDTGGRAVRVERRDWQSAEGREPACAPWRRRSGRKQVLGKIDRKKAAAGKDLFVTLCAGCHNAWPYTWTRAQQVRQALRPGRAGPAVVLSVRIPISSRPCGQYAITRAAESYLPGPFKDKDLAPTGDIYYGDLEERSSETALAQVKIPEAEMSNAARLPRAADAEAAGARVQGGAARRRLGDAAVHAQRLGAQPVRDAGSGEGAHEEVLRRARVRPGEGRPRHRRASPARSCSTRQCAATRTLATRSRTARAATA